MISPSIMASVVSGEDLQDREVSLVERDAHGFRVEVVAEENGEVVSPAGVDRFAASPQTRLVDDVVVNERRGVDEFDDGAYRTSPSPSRYAEKLRRKEQQRRAQPLAAAAAEIVADLGDRENGGLAQTDAAPPRPVRTASAAIRS